MKENIIKDFEIQYNEKFDYFECHEILEEAWKNEDKNLNKDCGYVCLLQLSVCLHHLRNKNYVGASKMYNYLRSHYTKEASIQIEEFYCIEEFEECLNVLEGLCKQKDFKHIVLKRRIYD